MNQNLTSYYSERAKEYDKVYQIPEEQHDLAEASKLFRELFSGKTILEIACGTGYWTEQLSQTASSIHATDINTSVIEIAKSRNISNNVSFEVADMFSLKTNNHFDALFGGFIWSHILLQDIESFILKISELVKPGSVIAFIDSKQVRNKYHDIRSIKKTDEYGNTYQERQLENGTSYLILKNFPSKEFLVHKLSHIATEIKYLELEHYWIVTCKLNV